MSLTIITSGGLSAANVTQGYPTFSIKYFLPIYDHTIDSGIHSTGEGFTSAAPLSGASLVSTTHDTLVGEKIWNFGSGATSAYIVSDDDFRVYEDGGDDSVANNYSGSTQSKSTRTNMVSGTDGIFPISQILSGSASPSVLVDNAAGANFTWTNMDVVPGSSVNQNLVLNRSNLWNTASYAPVETNTDPSERTTAHFICNIPNTAGDFKFNKVALYIQEVDMNGTATSEQPKLFGVSVLNNVVSILDNGGVDAFDLHVKLQFTANNTGTPKNIFYDTDYWNKLPASVSSPYGLFSSGDVAIGTSGIGGSWNPKAKLHLTDNQKPQLTLSKTYTGDEAVFEMKSDGSLGIATSLSAGTLAVGPNTVASGEESVAFGEGGT